MEHTLTKAELAECAGFIRDCKAEIARRVVGQQSAVDGILMALVAGGHVLLEGVPGLAKTLLVRTVADVSALGFKRIQFTPDLLPADVTGTLIYEQATGSFSVRKGPVFANVVLADEINRAPAKVQSALLEAMAERQVTIGETTYPLPSPFFVLATQNPIEQEGTYGLPEAELDRFLIKLEVPYPTPQEEVKIVRTLGQTHRVPVTQVLSQQRLMRCQAAAHQIVADDKIVQYIVSIVSVTRPVQDKKEGEKHSAHRNDILRYISFGASPRAGIAMLKCAKVHAMFDNRGFVLPEDVQAVAKSVLAHRLVLSYEASADSVSADDLIAKIIGLMPVP